MPCGSTKCFFRGGCHVVCRPATTSSFSDLQLIVRWPSRLPQLAACRSETATMGHFAVELPESTFFSTQSVAYPFKRTERQRMSWSISLLPAAKSGMTGQSVDGADGTECHIPVPSTKSLLLTRLYSLDAQCREVRESKVDFNKRAMLPPWSRSSLSLASASISPSTGFKA